ncbi:MAG: hypothetical protein WCF22_11225 [Candidatus Sulfotelmatobacter sp.]
MDEILCPKFRLDDGVVIGNFNPRKENMQARIEAVGATLFYLPPYSHGLRPIGQDLAKLEEQLRVAKARAKYALDQATADLLSLLTVRAFLLGRAYGMVIGTGLDGAL